MPLPLLAPLLASLGGAGAAAGAAGGAGGLLGSLGGVGGISSLLGGLGQGGGLTGGAQGGLGGLLSSGNLFGPLGSKAIDFVGGLLGFGKKKSLAERTFSFQKDAFNTNLANQTQTYNTSLEDRVRARHNTEGRSGAFTESYLGRNLLPDTVIE